jgi:hypothetical protein
MGTTLMDIISFCLISLLGFTGSPFSLTLSLLQALVAMDLVLKILIAHMYLSILILV